MCYTIESILKKVQQMPKERTKYSNLMVIEVCDFFFVYVELEDLSLRGLKELMNSTIFKGAITRGSKGSNWYLKICPYHENMLKSKISSLFRSLICQN